jgi:hypothetical protein
VADRKANPPCPLFQRDGTLRQSPTKTVDTPNRRAIKGKSITAIPRPVPLKKGGQGGFALIHKNKRPKKAATAKTVAASSSLNYRPKPGTNLQNRNEYRALIP